MSASDWSFCPACRHKENLRVAELAARVANEYGKVPVTEFDALRTEIAKGDQLEPTFREDYEFYGAEDGTVTASYSGQCDVCGVGANFTYRYSFWLPPT